MSYKVRTSASMPGDTGDGETPMSPELRREFEEVEKAFANQGVCQLAVMGQEPPKPREGLIVYANGSTWNPGSGEGFYGYSNGVWRKFH